MRQAPLRDNFVEHPDTSSEASVAEAYYRYGNSRSAYSRNLHTAILQTEIDFRNLEEIPGDRWQGFVISLFDNISRDLFRGVEVLREEEGVSAEPDREYYARVQLAIPNFDRGISVPYLKVGDSLSERFLSQLEIWLQSNHELILSNGLDCTLS